MKLEQPPITIMRSHSESRDIPHKPGVFFHCANCGKVKAVAQNWSGTCGTGYASNPETDALTCYDCCADKDREHMHQHGKITLYLSGGMVTNWPGTLKFKPHYSRSSWHNFAGKDGRRDVWFTANGEPWHGVNIGDNEILRCKRLKK